jgi:hypothetical protein
LYKNDGVYKNIVVDSIQNDKYIKEYIGYKNLGFSIFSFKCNKCHELYPDIKDEIDFNKIKEVNFSDELIKKHRNQTLDLNEHEINALKEYLRLVDNQKMVMP